MSFSCIIAANAIIKQEIINIIDTTTTAVSL